ncbi:MAG: hypothetical protein K8R21_08470 [Leptospira sp.]|nr:hypothetical protein [Leptospira sp.]
MMSEINLAAKNNQASHQFSRSDFTITKMPDRLHPLTNFRNEVRSPESLAKVGANSDPETLRRGYLIDLNA